MTVDMSTSYLGLSLEHPVIASAGPLTSTLTGMQSLAVAGAAAVVMPSLFEEEVVAHAVAEHRLYATGADVFAEAQTYLPELPTSGPADRYVELLARASASLDIPVIASLNGTSRGGWVRHAAEIEAAGASAIELNVYLMATDPSDTADWVEGRILELVSEVRSAVRIPVAVKLSPYFSALAHLVARIESEGADGIVLFNRFYQPEIDLSTLTVAPTLDLSTAADLRLPLRWTGVLRDHVRGSIALSGGVHSPDSVVKAVLAGADAVMATSALLKHGAEYLAVLRDGAAAWFERNDVDSVEQVKASMSRGNVPDPDQYERANYLNVLRSGRYG
jgi:dihydroorotate dehydrogenase (fumarate)